MNKWTLGLLCLIVICVSPIIYAAEEHWGEWLEIGTYSSLVDPNGNILLQTGRRVYLGDQYLTTDNRLYEITSVDEQNVAQTQLLEVLDLASIALPITEIYQALGLSVVEAQSDDQTQRIAVYHTHNAESYIPTDGTDSINGKGGIHYVGDAFSSALRELGIDVDYSEALHLPHDRGAYRRSRSTVLDLLAKNPDAIFDLHRDAAPINEYAAEIADEWVTQVQFVVGRQNQNLGINRQYAQSLKSAADKLYPGLVKGIYFARGNYNQDLSPLGLLLEVGAHTNSRDAAERGIALFAEVVDYYFYGPRDQREDVQARLSRASLNTLFWLAVFTISTTIVLYVINAGGFQAAWNRIRKK